MKSSEAAFAAAKVMSEQGHCKNVLQDGEGKVCYVGALLIAIEGSVNGMFADDSERFQDVDGMVRTILFERDDNMTNYLFPGVEFNNDISTTGEDVIQLLKEAGSRLQEADA